MSGKGNGHIYCDLEKMFLLLLHNYKVRNNLLLAHLVWLNKVNLLSFCYHKEKFNS